MNSDVIRVCLTEGLIKVLTALDITEQEYTETLGKNLKLYNAGPDIKMRAFDSHLEVQNNTALIPTGLRIVDRDDLQFFIAETSDVLMTGLVIRNALIKLDKDGEYYISVTNLNNRDAVIPAGAELPMELIVLKKENKFENIAFAEYSKRTM